MYDFTVVLFNFDAIVRGANCHNMHITTYTWVQLVFNTIWPMVMALLDPCFEFTSIMCWNPKNVLRGKGGGRRNNGKVWVCTHYHNLLCHIHYCLFPLLFLNPNNNVLAFLLQLKNLSNSMYISSTSCEVYVSKR